MRSVQKHSGSGKGANIMQGKVGCESTQFVLDTGAVISVVPDDVVNKEQMLGTSVTVVDANGGEVKRDLAEVWLHVGSLSMKQKVAVAPRDVLKGKALLAIDLSRIISCSC